MMTHDSETILIVVGHGSRLRVGAGAATRALVRVLARRGRFAAVHAAFLKGEPALTDVLAGLPDGARVRVVPHFSADGLFVREIIPRVLGHAAGRFAALTVTPPLGLHAGLAAPVAQLIADIGGADALVVGHGAPRCGQAAGSALAMAESLRPHARRVEAVFLEQSPRLADWPRLDLGRDLVVVTMLAGNGLHGGEQVPAAFGLGPGALERARSRTGETTVGPFETTANRLWFCAPLTDAGLLARLVEHGETDLSHRVLDHSQGRPAAPARCSAT